MFELDPLRELKVFSQATDYGKECLYESLLNRCNVLMDRWHKKIGYYEINNRKKSLAQFADQDKKPKLGLANQKD